MNGALITGGLAVLAACSSPYGLLLQAPATNGPYPQLQWRASKTAGAHYDLRIYREYDGELVYERQDLATTEHDTALPLPNGTYRWTVRVRLHTEQGVRVGPWSLAEGGRPRQLVAPPPKQDMHRFEIHSR